MARVAALMLAAAAVAATVLSADRAAAPPRLPWTTSRVTGSPDPAPPFTVVRAFPNASFKQPLLLVRAPGTGRVFVGERPGTLHSMPDRPDARPVAANDLAAELRTVPAGKRFHSLYALAFHPRFEQNRYCFVCYTLVGGDPADGTRVSRFAVTATDPPRLDPASEEIVVTWQQGGHNGCELLFGPDGMLYVSTGDSMPPSPPDPLNTGQDCSDLLSSILRIDVDRRDPGKTYAVPKDNPFVGVPGVRGEIWAFGLRNPWRMSFDRTTGDLWVGDVGWELWEMVHKVERGGNYGWSFKEGPLAIKPDQKPGPNPIVTPPVVELPHSVAASVTGGYIYRGKRFPELAGAYVFADYETRRLWAARVEDGRLKELTEMARPTVRASSFYQDPDGELYLLDYDLGTVHTLERAAGGGAANRDFPTKLSETGLFASVRDHAPAPGVVAFDPAARQWADGATAEHWAALPGTSAVMLYPKGKSHPQTPFGPKFRMHYPKDAVLLKTFTLDTDSGRRRVETQLLHFDGIDWRGYTFAWRDDQADADLVPTEGAEKTLTVRDPASGGFHEQVWTFHVRNQCLQCHSPWSEYSMAFNPAQLNSGVPNQLAALTERGFFRRSSMTDEPLPPFDPADLRAEPALRRPFDRAAGTVAERARSYLHANCGHCHRYNGGGTVQLQLHAAATAAEMRAIDIPPQAGDFGLPDARLIAPGDPARSVAYYRMAKFGRGRMPHFGSELPDEAGLDLVGEWIRSLAPEPSPLGVAAADRLTDPRAALSLARAVGRGSLPVAERDSILAAVAKLPAGGTVRDLFEGYLPTDSKGRRLGANPRPAVILAHVGDARRGEALFWAEATRCGACHRVGDRGTAAVGPDLGTVGKTRTRADLLESLLNPSRRIEQAFVAHTAVTADGRSVVGVLVSQDGSRVVIRDAQNKVHEFAAAEVEDVRRSPMSLMPEGLLAGLTPQEAADLVEYLADRKKSNRIP